MGELYGHVESHGLDRIGQRKTNGNLSQQTPGGILMGHIEFYQRRRRKLRYRRMGLFDPDLRVAQGAATASPVTDAQGDAIATLVFELESFGDAPVGVLYSALSGTGNNLDFVDPENLDLEIAAGVENVAPLDDLSSGIHTYVVAFDPANDITKLYVDGRLTATNTTAFAEWANATDTWDYLASVTNTGKFSDLEVYLGRVPAVF